MQIVIEILEEQYNKIKDLKMCEYGNYVALLDAVLTSIKNGTPLPKGYVALADSDKLIKEFDEYIKGLVELHDHRAVYGLELAKRIVENIKVGVAEDKEECD